MFQLIESFDVFGINDYAKRGWSAAFLALAAGRYGTGQAMTVNAINTKLLNANTTDTVFIQTGFKYSGTAEVALFTAYDGATPQFSLTFDPSASVFRVYRGAPVSGTVIGTSPPVAIAQGAWQFVEAKTVISDTGGAVAVNVNSALLINVSGQDTKSSSNAYINKIGIGGGASGAIATFDDLVVFDTAGSGPSAFLGDYRIDAVVPTADGAHADFIPSTGTAHWSLVDETAPNATDEVHSSTAAAIDTYVMGDVGTNVTIAAVQINVCTFKDTSGSRTIGSVIRQGTTDYVGTPQSPGVSEGYLSTIYTLDPSTGAAWTPAGFNAAELGVKVTA